jgi:AAHS family benzoate transporter-like MFS transporter
MLSILALVAGAGNSGAMNVAHGYVSAYYPHSARSTGLGFSWGVGRCGAILGPVIGGVLLSVSAQLSIIFLIIGLMGVFAAVVFALVQQKYSFTYVSRQAAAKQAELTQA